MKYLKSFLIKGYFNINIFINIKISSLILKQSIYNHFLYKNNDSSKGLRKWDTVLLIKYSKYI